MKKYSVFVCGENFLITLDGHEQKLGFYTTVFVEAQDEAAAEQATMKLLRTDKDLIDMIHNPESDSPVMFVEEIKELESFENVTLPRTGFSFFSQEEEVEGG